MIYTHPDGGTHSVHVPTERPETGEIVCYVGHERLDTVEHNVEYDWIRCVCGNEPHSDGFYTSDRAGEFASPFIGGSWDGNHTTCVRCGRVIDTEHGGAVMNRATDGFFERFVAADEIATRGYMLTGEHRGGGHADDLVVDCPMCQSEMDTLNMGHLVPTTYPCARCGARLPDLTDPLCNQCQEDVR